MGDTRHAPRARLASMAARALACARRCRRSSETGADAPSGARRPLPAGAAVRLAAPCAGRARLSRENAQYRLQREQRGQHMSDARAVSIREPPLCATRRRAGAPRAASSARRARRRPYPPTRRHHRRSASGSIRPACRSTSSSIRTRRHGRSRSARPRRCSRATTARTSTGRWPGRPSTPAIATCGSCRRARNRRQRAARAELARDAVGGL